jgi:16S rRNA (guanine1207-N2)-methyltransferase
MEVVSYQDGHRIGMAVKQSPEPNPSERFTEEVINPDFFHSYPVEYNEEEELEIFTRPGIFSYEHLDSGSAVLIEKMEIGEGETIAELGGGCGVISFIASKLCGDGHVDMVEVNAEAIRSAQKTMEENGIENCTIIAGDAGQPLKNNVYDLVLTNPPFHVSKSSELSIAFQFIADAHRILKHEGRLCLVANKTLPYEKHIQTVFGNLEIIHQDNHFKVLGAVK